MTLLLNWEPSLLRQMRQANGGGIVLKGATDKLITWSNTNDAWTFNQHVYPSADSSWDLGSTTIRWANIYGDAANITAITGALTGNADTATTLETARNISGVSFDGSQNITLVTDNVQESGTPTNIYFTDARARAAVSVTDSGGDGSLAYDSGTGVITYTGPSATEVRSHLSAGTGVGFSGGVISIGQAVGTSDSVQFAGITGPLTGNADTATHYRLLEQLTVSPSMVVPISPWTWMILLRYLLHQPTFSTLTSVSMTALVSCYKVVQVLLSLTMMALIPSLCLLILVSLILMM